MTDDSLPVPPQLEAQLDKCKTVRNAAVFYKPRTKTAEEIKAGRARLPDKPTASK
jgi:hypothetical protein